VSWFWVAVVAVVAYELGRSHELAAVIANSPGGRAAAAAGLTGPVPSTPTSGVVSAVNPPGSSAWMP